MREKGVFCGFGIRCFVKCCEVRVSLVSSKVMGVIFVIRLDNRNKLYCCYILCLGENFMKVVDRINYKEFG